MKYHFLCEACGEVTEADLSIGEYHRNPPALLPLRAAAGPVLPAHGAARASTTRWPATGTTTACAPATAPTSARAPSTASTCGRNNLTTVDDFKDQWARQRVTRDEYRTTGKGGAVTRDDIARAHTPALNR